jgi:sugar phosphate isomerase/epimerase
VQLYSVRQELERDFEGVVRQIAEMGYAGLETAGFPSSTSAEAAGRLFHELDLTVTSAHTPLPLGKDKNQVIETAEALGCRKIVCAYMPAENYSTRDKTRKTCDRLNEASVVAQEHGLELGIHNHAWEFEPVAGSYPYKAWLDYLEPGIFFELDTYWIQTAGRDPVSIVNRFGARAPLLHIKDGPANSKDAQTVAVGDGHLDFAAIIEASGGHADWLIVELDHCATDMLQAVDKSFHFLVKAGFGHGQKG